VKFLGLYTNYLFNLRFCTFRSEISRAFCYNCLTLYFTADRKITILNSQLFSFPVLLIDITVSRIFLPDTPSGDGGTEFRARSLYPLLYQLLCMGRSMSSGIKERRQIKERDA
jgi:hypothetical protein